MGFKYDSSKNKFDSHDLYGRIDMNDFKKICNDIYINNNFIEFEASTLKILNKNIPVSGGGYLRIFPWFLTKFLLTKYLYNNKNYFFYIHPFELSSNFSINLPSDTNLITKYRFNYGRQSVIDKIKKLFNFLKDNDYQFVSFSDIINKNIDFE